MGDPNDNDLTPEESLEVEQNLEKGLAARHTAREETIKKLDEHGILDKFVLRIEEALDAHETKFFAHQGKVITTRDVVAHTVRLTVMRLLAEIYGLGERKIEIDLSTDLPDMSPEMREIFTAGADLIVRKIKAIK